MCMTGGPAIQVLTYAPGHDIQARLQPGRVERKNEEAVLMTVEEGLRRAIADLQALRTISNLSVAAHTKVVEAIKLLREAEEEQMKQRR